VDDPFLMRGGKICGDLQGVIDGCAGFLLPSTPKRCLSETAEAIRIGESAWMENLDSDIAAECSSPRSIHLAHATRTQH
jgi:hypothetical protein